MFGYRERAETYSKENTHSRYVNETSTCFACFSVRKKSVGERLFTLARKLTPYFTARSHKKITFREKTKGKRSSVSELTSRTSCNESAPQLTGSLLQTSYIKEQ